MDSNVRRGRRGAFLDVDGVLNRYRPNAAMESIEESLAANFDYVVANVVPLYTILASSWRKYADLLREVMDRVVIHDCTDTLPTVAIRGDEVALWLYRNPGLSRYAVIDDEDDFYPWQPLFHTDGSEGLTRGMAGSVVEWLNGSWTREHDERSVAIARQHGARIDRYLALSRDERARVRSPFGGAPAG